MAMNDHKTARYRIIADAGGNRYRFYCDASGMAVCTTKPIRADTREEELRLAWETEGRQYFNRCTKCGRWISDKMYNADVLQCVDCAPWQNKPNYCAHCGEKITDSDVFCRKCGVRLRYGEVTA